MAMESSALIVDYIVFLVFIVITTIVPLWEKGKSTANTKANYVFAKAGGVSMFAMMLSISRGTLGVRSFLGFPSELFYRGSAMWETVYGMVLANFIIAYVFVPVYFSLGITSVYQYLDLRFKSRSVRFLASATYIFRQVLNLGVTVFTPCVALNTVIGLPYWASILGIVFISVVFNAFGGLKAAIKADVIQTVTTIIITFGIIIQCCIEVGGVSPIVTTPSRDGRLKFFQFKWDPTVRVDTFTAVLCQTFMSASMNGCQQNFVQRYCSMKSVKNVRKTLMSNIPMILVLFSLCWVAGMAIYAVYADCDPLTSGYTKKMDEILPFFIEDKFNYLPGVMGLFMASLFNGALSITVSNINSLATVTWEDFLSHAPAFSGLKDRQQLVIIKILGAIYGVVIMGIAFGVGFLSGVVESGLLMTSATSGPLLGVFLLAMLIPCSTKKGAIVGMILSHMITIWAAIGHLMAKSETVMLPLSVEGCTNETFSAHITKPRQQWPLPSIPLEVNKNTTHFLDHYNHFDSTTVRPIISDSNPFKPFYLMTYMYYALLGTFITVVVGIIVSLLTKTTEDDIYDEKLLHPWVLKMSRKFPGKPRRYLSKEQVENQMSKQSGKNCKEVDNPAFEMMDDLANHIVIIEKSVNEQNHKNGVVVENNKNGVVVENNKNGVVVENHKNGEVTHF